MHGADPGLKASRPGLGLGRTGIAHPTAPVKTLGLPELTLKRFKVG